MRRSVLFAVLAAVLVSATLQQAALESIGAKFRRAAPGGMGNLGSYVAGVQSHGFYEEATFHVSQIAHYASIARTFQLGGCAGSVTVHPWKGVEALKFGSSYSQLFFDKTLNFPGATWVRATGIVGIRQGTTITTKVAYGWAAGNGHQLQTTTTVRKCKKKLFRKKCWDEKINIPRGVSPQEAQAVSDGMYHLMFNKVADVAGHR